MTTIIDIDTEDKQFIENYMAMKSILGRIEQELDEMKPRMFAIVSDFPEAAVRFGAATITCKHRNTYEYSDTVKSLEDTLRKMKRAEERNGTATLVRQTGYVAVSYIE